jgi:hypothetical protein
MDAPGCESMEGTRLTKDLEDGQVTDSGADRQ